MDGITRITASLLDVLAFFLASLNSETQEVHGWAIVRGVKRSTTTVYGVLDRLEEAEWITGRWEDNPEEGRPRRRMYQLTPNGKIEALRLLAERRPAQNRHSARPGLAFLQTLLHGGPRATPGAAQ